MRLLQLRQLNKLRKARVLTKGLLLAAVTEVMQVIRVTLVTLAVVQALRTLVSTLVIPAMLIHGVSARGGLMFAVTSSACQQVPTSATVHSGRIQHALMVIVLTKLHPWVQ